MRTVTPSLGRRILRSLLPRFSRSKTSLVRLAVLEETDSEGNSTEQILLMTVPRAWTAQHGVIQAQAEIGWGTGF